MLRALLGAFAGLGMLLSSWFGFSEPPVTPLVTPVPVATTAPVGNSQVDIPLAPSNSNTRPASSNAQTTVMPTGSTKYADGILPLGDGKYSTTAPEKGYIYVCHVARGGEGAQGTPDWINTANNTWDINQKIAVQGSITWPDAYVHVSTNGTTRTIESNDLPTNHNSGIFPIQQSDPAHAIDANPSSIKAQNINISLPENPTIGATPNCIYGAVGIMANGVLLLDGFDAEYRDAAAHEVQDSCAAHPNEQGYHYHSLSPCIPDATVTNIIGWAYDGFPITGPKLPNGNYLTTSDLDECHGMTSDIEENGQMVSTYHYVMTEDFPYSVGCFMGKSYEPVPAVPQTQNQTATSSGQGGPQNGQSGAPQGGQNGPPQAALDACDYKSTGASCSFSAPQGTISGTCQTPPNASLACVPQ